MKTDYQAMQEAVEEMNSAMDLLTDRIKQFAQSDAGIYVSKWHVIKLQKALSALLQQ